MKILHINKYYAPYIGGIERVVQDIAEGLQKKGFENEVLVCGEKNAVDSVHGVTIYRTKTFITLFRMPISFEFFKIFRARVMSADVIFLHHPFPLALLAYAFFGRSRKLVVWYHSDIVRQRCIGFLIQPLIRYILRMAHTIFVSNKNIIEHSPMLKAFRSQCIVAPFGIDIAQFKKTREIEKEAANIRKQYPTPVVLAVGRCVYYKGFEYLIRAMKGIRATLLIVGSGPREELLKRLAHFLRLKNIIFIPHVQSLIPYYYASDIFVLPSCERSEAFGIVQLEAMACGLPVINTALPTGVPEVSINGETGITVPPKDSEHLHGAIQHLIHDDKLRMRYAEQALKRVQQFSRERFIEKIFRVLVAEKPV